MPQLPTWAECINPKGHNANTNPLPPGRGFSTEVVMKNTSLCYIENDGCYLMMHRIKKENDENHDKWVGIGGKFENGETPEQCVLREVKEETGLTLTDCRYRGIITFHSDEWGSEVMHLFTSDHYEGELTECSEGTLEWVPKENVCLLPIWEGDKIFFRLLNENAPFFHLELSYSGDRLVSAYLNGNSIHL